jgi:hypothetical protein
VTLDDDARPGIGFQKLGKAIESAIGTRFQCCPAAIEQHIAQGHYHSAIGLLGLEVLQLLPGVGELALSALSRALCGLRLAPRLLCLTLARLKHDAVAFLLGLGDFLACPCRLHSRLSGLRMTECEIREMVHLFRGLSLLKRHIGLLQIVARRLNVRACGLLRQ